MLQYSTLVHMRDACFSIHMREQTHVQLDPRGMRGNVRSDLKRRGNIGEDCEVIGGMDACEPDTNEASM